jgi:hypothetical protein
VVPIFYIVITSLKDTRPGSLLDLNEWHI